MVGENSKDINDEVWKKPNTVKRKQKMMRNYQEPETAFFYYHEIFVGKKRNDKR